MKNEFCFRICAVIVLSAFSLGLHAADLRIVAACEREGNAPNVKWGNACVNEQAFSMTVSPGHLIVYPMKEGPSWVGLSCDGLIWAPSKFNSIEEIYLEANGKYWGPLLNAGGTDESMCGRIAMADFEEAVGFCLDVMDVWGESSEKCFTVCEGKDNKNSPQICVWHAGLDNQ